MKLSKLIAAILCLAMICTLFAACGGETKPSESTNEPKTSESLGGDAVSDAVGKLDGTGMKIGLSQQHLTNDFNRGILAGATAMAKELGAELITANAQGDSNKQVSDMENFLTMGVDAVIIGGGEAPAFTEVIKKMNDANIPIITIDMSRSDTTDCNLTSDNFNAGEQLALYVANKLGGVGNILLLDTPGWHSIEIRVRMLEEVTSDYPDLNIVQTISIGTQDAVNNYAKEVKAYLQGNPDIQCIYADWGLAAVGASQALREMGLTDKIFVVTIDADQVVMDEMMKDDSPLTAVIGQYPAKMGSGAVENAIKAAQGQEIPGEIYIPIILIEKSDPYAWFSSPEIMLPQEAWDALYGEAN